MIIRSYMIINSLPKSPKIKMSLGLRLLFYKMREMNQMVTGLNIHTYKFNILPYLK